MLAKCGSIKAWHWAHERGHDCDAWAEESAWHRLWKMLMPADQVEVTIRRNGTAHRADIVKSDGMVIELQHSTISPEEIREREQFYRNMAWLFDIRDCWGRFEVRLDESTRGQMARRCTFRWKYPRKHIATTRRQTFLDLSDGILWLKKMYPDCPCGGWGYWYGGHDGYANFIKWLTKKEELT